LHMSYTYLDLLPFNPRHDGLPSRLLVSRRLPWCVFPLLPRAFL
jgi:hypothetical protein